MLLVVAGLFLLDLLVSVGGVGISLVRIRDRFDSVGMSIQGKDALKEVRELRRDADRARWFTSHPSYVVAAAAIPDLRLARDMSSAAADIARGAASLLTLLTNESDGSLYQQGRIDLSRVRSAAEASEHLHGQMVRWTHQLQMADAAVWDRAERASVEVVRRLRDTASDIHDASLLLNQLPPILGQDEPRSYLLVFQSPSEARGGGGLIGVVAELEADEGEVTLGRIRTVRNLVKRMRGSVKAPDWFEKTYGPLLATREWRSANVSPNFPVTSRVLLRMYRRSVGRTLDGVVATDPLAIAALTKAVGPVHAKGWKVWINQDNARRVLLHDVYRHFHLVEHRQNRYFANLIDEIWQRVTSEDVETAALASSIAESVRKQHLKAFLVRSDEQAAVAAVDADGSFAGESGVQLVFNNNWSANKIDFFLRRRIQTLVRLNEEGSAEVSVDVQLSNEIEKLDRNVIARPGVQRELPIGLNRTLLSVVLPQGASGGRAFVDRRLITTRAGTDGGHRVLSVFVDIPPGETRMVSFTYEWPSPLDGDRFRMTLFPQATVRPDVVTLTLIHQGKKLLQRTTQLKEPFRVSVDAPR